MLTPPERLQGARVSLRRSTAADHPPVFACASDPQVMKYMDWPAHTSPAQTEQFFAGVQARCESGEDFHWMIETVESGAFLGCIACRIRGHAADFGYFLARPAWGHGRATQAVTLLVDWLWQQPGILRIWATTDAENQRSQRVLERAGLVREGRLRLDSVRPNLGSAWPRDKDVFARVKPLPARPGA